MSKFQPWELAAQKRWQDGISNARANRSRPGEVPLAGGDLEPSKGMDNAWIRHFELAAQAQALMPRCPVVYGAPHDTAKLFKRHWPGDEDAVPESREKRLHRQRNQWMATAHDLKAENDKLKTAERLWPYHALDLCADIATGKQSCKPDDQRIELFSERAVCEVWNLKAENERLQVELAEEKEFCASHFETVKYLDATAWSYCLAFRLTLLLTLALIACMVARDWAMVLAIVRSLS